MLTLWVKEPRKYGIVTVDQEYEGTYIDKIVLHIEYEDKMFTAEFVRNGR